MLALFGTIALLILCFFVQKANPFLAGIIAVVPVKIIGVVWMVFETGAAKGLEKVLEGLLLGQFSIGILLLCFYLGIKYA